ncbi:MAG TPA: prepilin-type N-terminal cleavage/methylation domain-containing protein [Candidatus Binataceae bacterium]|jgi:prepilin-type N-terminal cleavage/methylation domain-containing protein|nr:prepilin-type N-terminal cleavage/methylation domain-containing protein [Candidatus Binataceae bacterium]
MTRPRPLHKPVAAARGFARGFTLIEMMLAVAILGIVMVMLAGSFHAVVAGKTHAEDRLLGGRAARALLRQITNELHGAIQTPLVLSRVLLVGQASMRNGVPLDSLSISTINVGHRRAVSGFGAEEAIVYSGVPNPRHPGWFMLMRQEQSALLGATAGIKLAPPVVLAANVLAFHLRYFNGNIWLESWDSHSMPPGQQLPQAVSIDVVLAGLGRAPIELATQVTLPMAIAQW